MTRHGRHRRSDGSGGAPAPGARRHGRHGAPPDHGSAPGVWPAPALPDPALLGEPALIADVRRLLRVGGPLDLLATVSSMLSLVDPRTLDPYDHLRPPSPGSPGRDELELETLLASFLEARLPESTALLAALGVLAPDRRARARANDEVARRGHRLPSWVAGLAQATSQRAVLVSPPSGDADNVLVGVRLPPAHQATVSVYVDHDEGTVVTDCVVLSARLGEVVAKLRAVIDDPGTRFDDLALPDARVRLVRAIDNGAAAFPPIETDDWPMLRPLVEWVARIAAPGSDGGS
jgi:hypothetical protein